MWPLNDSLRVRVRDHLAGFEIQHHDGEADLKHAAVAVCLAHGGPEHPDRAALLLTRRSSRLSAHPGQWAFPGGRLDPGETPLMAARRELFEELALDLPEASLLGRLDDYETRSGYVISPFVFWAPDSDAIVANPDEVAEIHRIALTAFDRPDLADPIPGIDPDRPIFRINLLTYQINAPTAAILYQFWEVGVHGRHTRVAHYDQPEWAWR
ncbi:MAG: NUDIX hydrolase [Alphaproteobacteria bacterium]